MNVCDVIMYYFSISYAYTDLWKVVAMLILDYLT